MKTGKKTCLVFSFAIAISILSCRSKENIPIEEHYGEAEGSVGFDLTNVRQSSDDASSLWDAIYKSAAHVARFTIVLEKPEKSVSSPILLRFGKGKFLAVKGSDNTALIAELKKQLEAKSIPAAVARVQELPFEYVILGEDQHRNSKVHWITMKLFLGDDEGEVYLNLNPAQNKGEFTIKDSDYGDFVVGQLARVL